MWLPRPIAPGARWGRANTMKGVEGRSQSLEMGPITQKEGGRGWVSDCVAARASARQRAFAPQEERDRDTERDTERQRETLRRERADNHAMGVWVCACRAPLAPRTSGCATGHSRGRCQLVATCCSVCERGGDVEATSTTRARRASLTERRGTDSGDCDSRLPWSHGARCRAGVAVGRCAVTAERVPASGKAT
jgi:hypothetical protein